MRSYKMSCFKLPISLCKRIQSILTRFWWNDKLDERKMSWVLWQKMTMPKNVGGFGFRDIEEFNDALLAKLRWSLLNHPEALLSRVLTGKYCHNTPFLTCVASTNASHGWRGILAGRKILQKGLGWLVGNGESIRVWDDPWLSSSEHVVPYGPRSYHLSELRVSDLLVRSHTAWNWERIRVIIPMYKFHIQKLVLGVTRHKDSLAWLPTKNGVYTTKSGHGQKMIDHVPPIDQKFNWQKKLWRLRTQPKIKSFLWKAAVGALSVGEQLSKKGISEASQCHRCGEHETVVHTLFHCR